jgi:hypothetical protein
MFAKPLVVNGISIRSLAIYFLWQELRNDHRRARLDVSLLGSTLVRFDEVVRLFGPNWTNAPIEAPIPHRHYDTVTAPHGNQVILYELHSSAGQANVRVEFHGDGSLRDINILSE